MTVIAMSNGKGESQGTDSSVETTAVQMNGSDKTDQILSIVSGIQVDVTELKLDMNKVKSKLTSIEGSVEAIGLKLDGFRD